MMFSCDLGILDGSQIHIIPGAIHACGSFTHSKGSPFICNYDKPDISLDDIHIGVCRINKGNQQDYGPCRGCSHLTNLPDKPLAKYFTGIGLHDFDGCNSKCVYCKGSEYSLPVKFKAVQDHRELFNNLLQSGLVKSGKTSVEWGGGEPTLLDTFEETARLLSMSNIHQVINTSGIKFSPAAAQALHDKTATVQISVDSGTVDTFERVKRHTQYELVWWSVKNYAATRGDLIVKYIIFPMNSGLEDIEVFIDKCHRSGVKSICISVNWLSLNSQGSVISDKEILAAAAMYNLANAKGMKIRFIIWPAQMLARIGRLGGFSPNYDKPGLAVRIFRGLKSNIRKQIFDERGFPKT